ncbi:MAG: Hsp20 family protein [Candidatus Acidiferrales bacterium]|jgi:HSP20 family protein
MNEKATATQMAPVATSVKLVEPSILLDRRNQIHDSIELRAFEIFQNNGGILGRELDDWFRAEEELLHPVHLSLTESEDAFTVGVEVPGFSAEQLQVSLEPRRLMISGKKEISKDEEMKAKIVYREQCSDEILRVIDLPAEVDAAKATAILKHGVLQLKLPKGLRAGRLRDDVKGT